MNINANENEIDRAVLNVILSSYKHLIVASGATGSQKRLFKFEFVENPLSQKEQRSEMGEAKEKMDSETSVLMSH